MSAGSDKDDADRHVTLSEKLPTKGPHHSEATIADELLDRGVEEYVPTLFLSPPFTMVTCSALTGATVTSM